jgi:hypothetical protein
MKPDVIIICADQTTLFQVQNQRVSDWVRRYFRWAPESGGDLPEFQVHPSRRHEVVMALRAAGFTVAD